MEPPYTPLVAGSTVGPYQVDAVLGRGGMGSIHRATDVRTGQVVALKCMSAQAAANPEFRRRFLREARAAVAVRHPNIVEIVEVIEHLGAPYIAMELLEGESFEAVLQGRAKLPPPEVARTMIYVASGLGTAHAKGIVHRDMKPDNIFVLRGPPHVKVIDFGIAKLTATEGEFVESVALTGDGAVLGTPYYLAPEQAMGEKRIDQRADVWSIGLILYRALSGVLPTDGDTFQEVFSKVMATAFAPLGSVAPEVPAELAAFVDRSLRKDRERRPWDLTELYALLAPLAEGTSAPSFGTAVEPEWDASTTVVVQQTPVSEPRSVGAFAPRPLVLTPASGRGSHGTVALSSTPTSERSPPASSAPQADKTMFPMPAPEVPVTGRVGPAVLGVALLAVAGLLAWFFLIR